MRYEFQHRGTIHCHMVMSMENGPTIKEMEFALYDLPEYPKVPTWTKFDDNLYDEKTEEEKEIIKSKRQEQYEKDVKKYDEIKAAKEKMIEFNSLIHGVYAVHPELDFENWPAPRGKNPYKPKTNVLRDDLLKYLGDPEGLLEYWRQLVNRIQLHKCKKGSCLTETFKTITTQDGKKETVKKRHCRFNFPFPVNGFKVDLNEDVEPPEIEGIEPDLKEHNDTIGDPLKYGASYQKQDPIDTTKMIQTSLELLRNHPDMNNQL